jgi:hypothetical protein
MGFRKAHDARRASTQAPTVTREDTTRTRPRESEVGEPREETDTRNQEEREEWADGGVQDPSEGFGSDKALYREVLLDENPITSDFVAYTSICPPSLMVWFELDTDIGILDCQDE